MAFYGTHFDVWPLVRGLQEFYMNIYLGSYKNLLWVGVEVERVLEALQGLSLHNTSQSSTAATLSMYSTKLQSRHCHPGSLPNYLGATRHLCPITMLLAFHSYLLWNFYSYPHSLQLSRAGTSILFAQCSIELLVATQLSCHSYFYSVNSKI